MRRLRLLAVALVVLFITLAAAPTAAFAESAAARIGGPALAGLSLARLGQKPVPCRNPPAHGQSLPAAAPRDPTIARLGLDRAWDLSTGAKVTVAVVDSGVDGTQPKLRPALAPGSDFVTTQTPPGWQRLPGGLGDCGDNGGTHGTAVAGLIAARPDDDDRIIGVAPRARIAPIRIVDGVQNASPEMIAAAIRKGADLGQVLNLSLALPVDRPAVRAAIRYALDHDVVVVAAAGNESSNGDSKWYPAAYPGVLAVAALKQDGTPLTESNRGSWVGIAAPGDRLTALAAGGGYTTVSGTSFATALVSGVAALVRSRFPDMSAAEVVHRLTATAVPLGAARDDRVGAGIIDPFAALSAQSAAVPSDPGRSGGPAGASGRVRVLPRQDQTAGIVDRWGTLLGAAGVLAVAAALAYLGRLALLAARRRRKRPGDQEPVEEPAVDPPDVRLA
ncbi:type VII secretion-associated serine protease mycosin [Plantactinospora siamensis]|uniref:Type VII secretion-associated serine protease mycosin n=1 Tax=Plantactinospora siamensis TaxID=555372 RepID=A0ABV6NPB6_9ACTN